MKNLYNKYRNINLIIRIIGGLIFGVIVGVLVNIALSQEEGILNTEISVNILYSLAVLFKIFGELFIGALRAIAPILVFFLVSSSIMNSVTSGGATIKRTMILYGVATFLASVVAVVTNTLFQIKLVLPSEIDTSQYTDQSSISDVIINIFTDIVSNPIQSIANANFLGVLFWALMLGIIAKSIATDNVKDGFKNLTNILTAVVKVIIEFAPFGICGLVFTAVVDSGIGIFMDYGMLLCVYIAGIGSMALIVNPLLCFVVLRRNPYPLVFKSIKEVGITAFFLRSSAANIPVNMEFCEKLHLDKDKYFITIPLGSAINMEGAAITIITLTLACCKALGIEVDFGPALLLSVVATISAVGASGVSGGSILLVPMACSLFGISGDIAAGVVAIGFIIGVVQDSLETALNSSTDGLFTSAVQLREQIKSGKPYHKIVGGTLDDKTVKNVKRYDKYF